MQALCPNHLILDLITLTILTEEYILWSSSLYNFLNLPVTSPLLAPNTFKNRGNAVCESIKKLKSTN